MGTVSGPPMRRGDIVVIADRDGGVEGLGELAGGELLAAKPVAGIGEGEAGEVGHGGLGIHVCWIPACAGMVE